MRPTPPPLLFGPRRVTIPIMRQNTDEREDAPATAFAFGPDAIVHREQPELPPNQDYWVFGYGSLMWNPEFDFAESRSALLRGYHRRFCIYSTRYRGTPDCPGLVLGLDRGGACRGMIFRVGADRAQDALDYLWEREMVTGAYRWKWLTCRTEQGAMPALCFIADPKHPQYAGRLSLDQTLQYIRQAEGRRGPCRDYLANTTAHLDELGIHDRMLKRLTEML